MIRATAGVWLNYATTFAFQVLFATRYGSGREASAFVITFAIAIAVSGVVASSAQSIVLPRLLTRDDSLARYPLRLLVTMTLGGIAVMGVLALAQPLVHSALGGGSTVDLVSSLIRPAALFGAFQVAVGATIVASLARGRRFSASVAPAAPSILGIAYLAAIRDPSLRTLYLVLALGSAVELLFILGTAGLWLPVRHTDDERVGRLTVATMLQFMVFGSVAPLERLAASWKTSAGAANYNYAIRSIASVQQLLIGGVLLAAGADWSALSRRDQRDRLSRSVAARTSLASLVLVLVAVVGALLARTLVRLVFEHGSFTPTDTRAVSALLVLALPGFFADGVAQVLSQSLIAVRANRVLVQIGLSVFGLRAGLIVAFGVAFGAKGVAVAYTAASAASLLITGLAVHRRGIITRGDSRLLARSGIVACVMIAVGIGAASLSAPAVAKAALAVAAFAILVLGARLPDQLASYARGA